MNQQPERETENYITDQETIDEEEEEQDISETTSTSQGTTTRT